MCLPAVTNTYRSVHETAQLEWRLAFARKVLRDELFHSFTIGLLVSCGLRTKHEPIHVGTKSPMDGKYYHHFLYVRSAPGGKNRPQAMAQKVTLVHVHMHGAIKVMHVDV